VQISSKQVESAGLSSWFWLLGTWLGSDALKWGFSVLVTGYLDGF
jgi:hypothetical protein